MKTHFGNWNQFEAEGSADNVQAFRAELDLRLVEIDKVLTPANVGGFHLETAHGRALITRRSGFAAGLELKR